MQAYRHINHSCAESSKPKVRAHAGPKMQLPLSDHLVRVFKTSDGRPDGLVQYHFYCEHNMERPIKADRIIKVASVMDKHANCW